jgi:hypothetical protein
MKSKNKISKIIATAMVCLSVTSFGMITAEAGNYKDTWYKFEYNGDGGDRFTPNRPKWDDTSSYIYNCNSNTGLKVTVYGNSVDNGSIGAMCSITPFQQVNIGQELFLDNWVKERKYTYARLGLSPNTHSSCHLEGKWSPDSIR